MTTHRKAAAALTMALAAVMLTGCDGGTQQPKDGPSEARKKRLAACETAFREEWRRSQEDQDEGTPPRECRDVSKRAMKRILLRVIREETPRLDPETGEVEE